MDAWRPVSAQGAPAARFNHTAVWTGKEMVVWGGYTDSRSWYAGARNPGHLNTGGRYDPVSDRWRNVTLTGAPAARFNHTAVWTGSEMLVWGGGDTAVSFNDGALYDPLEDSWRPVTQSGAPEARQMHAAVWTGKEMIIWGGTARDSKHYFQDGGRYNPVTDTWKPVSNSGAPKGRIFLQAVWTGRQMLVWGGVNDAEAEGTHDPGRYVGNGALYDPASDRWTAISSLDAPGPRLTSAVWTGDSLLTFGGYNGTHLNDTFQLRLNR
jgi:N-acetylneuraminic acid mutarotase